MKPLRLASSLFIFTLLVLLVGTSTRPAGSEPPYQSSSRPSAADYLDGCSAAADGDWKRAADSFSKACGSLPKEGKGSYFRGDTHDVYGHLGLGHALLRVASSMTAGARDSVAQYTNKSKSELLDAAISELERSWKDTPSEPARVCLIEALLEAQRGGEIKKYTGSKSNNLKSYALNTLGKGWNDQKLAAALDKAMEQLGAGLEWHFFAADGQELAGKPLKDVVSIRVEATTPGITVTEWQLEELRGNEGRRPLPIQPTGNRIEAKWDTLAEDEPAEKGTHQLQVKVKYHLASGIDKVWEPKPWDVVVKNPNWVKIDLLPDTPNNRAKVIVRSSRPLPVGSRCALDVDGEKEPQFVRLEPIREEFRPTLQPAVDQKSNTSYEWRYCYQGFSQPGIVGLVKLRDPGQQNGIKLAQFDPLINTEPLSLAPTSVIIDSRLASVPANGSVPVEVTSTRPFTELKGFRLLAVNRKTGRERELTSNDPDSERVKKYSFKADPDFFSTGITLLAKVDGQEKDSLYIPVETPVQLQGEEYPDTIRVGEAIPLRFTFSRPLAKQPTCKLMLNGMEARNRYCFPVSSTSYRTELFVADPGDYTVVLIYQDPVLGEQTIQCNRKITVKADQNPRFFLDVPLHLPQGTHPVRVSVEGKMTNLPDSVPVKVSGAALATDKQRENGEVLYIGKYTVEPGAKGDVHFVVDAAAGIEGTELTVSVDGQLPELSASVPPISEDVIGSDRPVRIRVYSNKALNGVPSLEIKQGNIANPCKKVQAVGAREWVAEALISAIPGPAFVHIRGTDTFGNTRDVSNPLPISIESALRLNVETQQPWKAGDNTFTVYVNEGALADLTVHLQGDGTRGGTNAVRLAPKGASTREFTGQYSVQPGQRGFVDLMLGSRLVRRVFVDAVGPKPVATSQWISDSKLRVTVRDQCQLKTVAVSVGGKEYLLTQVVNDADRSEWYAEIPVVSENGAVNFAATVTDYLGRVGAAQGTAPLREKRDWHLTSDLSSVPQGGKVTFKASSSNGGQQKLILKITPARGKDGQEVVPVQVDMEGRNASESRYVWQLAEDTGPGTADIELFDLNLRSLAKTQISVISADIRPDTGGTQTSTNVEFKLVSPEPGKLYHQLPQAVFQLPKDANPRDYQARFTLVDPARREYKQTLTPQEVETQTKAVVDEDAPDTVVRNIPTDERRFKLADLASAPVDGPYSLTVELLDAKGQAVGSKTSAFSYRRPQVDKSKRWAIIVAVSKYYNPLTKELPLSYSDAAKLRLALARSYGHISVITDAPCDIPGAIVKADTAANLNGALDDELDKARKAGTEYLFFAFTGHGMGMDGESYLLPAKFDQDTSRTMVSIKDTLRSLTGRGLANGNPIPHVLVLLDACQNAFGSKNRLQMISPPARATKDQTVHILASCQPNQVSLTLNNAAGGNAQGSLFTDKFVHLLKQGGYDDWIGFGDALTRQVRSASASIVQMNPALAAKLEKDYAQEPLILTIPQSPDVLRNLNEFFDKGQGMANAHLASPLVRAR